MRKTLLPSLVLVVFVLMCFGLKAQFTAGNLAVFRAESSGANNTTFSIIELNPAANQASPVHTIAIEGTTGANALRTSGSATSTGYLATSNDGSLLCFTGHNSTSTSGNANTITARGVGTLNAAGTFNLAATYTGSSGNQTRCATTLNNSNWFIGDQGGIYSNGSTSASPSGNFRSVKAFGGVVYVFSASASAASVGTLANPTGSTITGLPGLPNGSSNNQDFYFISSGNNGSAYDVLYILATSGATAGSISKFSLVSGSWVANGTYTTPFGGFGLAAAKQGSSAVLYATSGTGATTANNVIKLTDNAGYNALIDITTANNVILYTTTSGTTLKGIAFAPAPPPPAGAMRITEYMYDGANGEYIEFTNVGSTPVDMTGYSFDDDSRIPGTVSLSSFGIVQPGESVILTETNSATFRAAWGLCGGVKVIGGNATNLGRDDEINLFDATGTLVDRLTYGDDVTAPGTIRTQKKSGYVNAAGLGANTIASWTLSAAADAENSVTSSGGDIGSPGKSTRAIVNYNPCSISVGAPTISIDVVNTTNLLDAGVSTSPSSPYAVSGTINDPVDPAATLGLNFTIGDDVVPVGNLTVTVSSSNTTVVPNGNLVLTGSGASRSLKITPAAVGRSIVTVTVNNGTLTTSYVINYGASQSASNAIKWPTGMADASGAVPVDDDYMVIANDENNLLYLYNRNASGLPVKTFDFNANNLLGLTDGSTNNWKEVDVEAAAISPTHAGRSYWLGSMSNSSSFNDKPNRNRLFAIDMNGTGAATTFSNAGFYADLRHQLIVWGDAHGYAFSASAAAGVDPKATNGFNAEGLVFGPDNTTLYIGFRAPLVPLPGRTNAVIAPLLNFETWFNNGSPAGDPTFGAPVELDLGGRGIRDMIRLSNGNYVIIAGSSDETLSPALYRWTGNTADAPVALPSLNVDGLNAEGAMPINEGGQLSLNKLQIICDNGDNVFYNDGTAAKDLSDDNLKKFTSVIITSAGSVLPVHFESFTAQRKGTDVQLNWKNGDADQITSFDVMRSENGSNFVVAGTVQAIAHSNVYSFTDAHAPAKQLYYRIRAKDISGQEFFTTIRPVAAGTNGDVQIKIYPNPVSNGVFSVLVNKAGAKTVSVYNNAGILFKQEVFTDNAKDISTGNWPKGYYLVRVSLPDNSIITQKIEIQ